MDIVENNNTYILPRSETKSLPEIDEIEKQIKLLILSKDPNMMGYYDRYSSFTSVAVFRDIVKNLEDYFKSKNIADEKDKVIINKTFDTLKNQFNVLELFNSGETNNQILIIIFSTIFSHLKKLLY